MQDTIGYFSYGLEIITNSCSLVTISLEAKVWRKKKKKERQG